MPWWIVLPYRRASLIAASLASAPELQKNSLPPNDAFEILSDSRTASADIRCELIAKLSSGAGALGGMVAGQMLDIYAEDNPEQTSETIIKRIEEMKTGRLISFACEAGAILGQASDTERQKLQEYSRGIGIAFQIADDILDVEGDPKLVGKALNKDAAQGKMTFVSLYGLDKAKQIEKELIEKAQEALSPFGAKAENLRRLASYIIERKN